ncbi:glycosyltransferase [Nocardiopsis mangrovi]|uniref:Glycosyltransferase n=1 Tax=Nocardiopsis mangrovi TaxID=1179818 RepID=A0ABV9E448_9ACTN
MRTARFIGNWLAGLIAFAVTATVFVLWLRYGLGAAGGPDPAPLFLWLVVGVNLLVWTLVGLVRLGDDSLRVLAARRAPAALPGPGGTAAARRVADRRSALVGASAAGVGAGGAAGSGLAPDPADGPSGPPAHPAAAGVGADGGGTAAGPAPLSLAVVIPAHNEEPVIDGAIASALRLFNRWDIYVVSDSSHDSTADIAAETGVNVLELLNNRGKAGALEAVIEEFDLTGTYDGVVILDADTELHADYVEGVRRQLREPDVAAVAGFVVAEWKPDQRTVVGRLISAYRDRLYWMLQYLMRYGQTWRRTSVPFIVPGFASTYRSSALKKIDINPSGLVIEDYNMTFEVHRKRLGRIAMHPGTKAYSQDPFTLGDYISQVRRWTLGFWQTVRRHGVWPGLFWFALSFYILEVVLVATLLLAAVVLGAFLLLPEATGGLVLRWDVYADGYGAATAALPLTAVAVGLFVPDYIVTCVLAVVRRRPGYLVYGLFFLPVRVIDAYLTLRTIPQAWTVGSNGRWKSPNRAATRL